MQDRASLLEIELEDVTDRAAMTQARLDQTLQSVSFRLGATLVAALKSWRGLVAFPGSLLRLARDRGAPAAGFVTSDGTRRPPSQPLARVPPPQSAHSESLPTTLAELRVVAILDQFSERGFSPDCSLINLPREGFEPFLDQVRPHLLLVESAWRGLDGQWRNQLSPVSSRLRYLVDCCRRRGIPTVFWNKEDPVHFEHFLAAARLFDHVLTTDADCVERYREMLGHSRVGVLPFACQPTMHNPVETVQRRKAACFAGSWYRAYPERCRSFDEIVAVLQELMPVVIYDRNHDRGDPSFAFPERYRPLIMGGLPYERIDEAYKSCTHAIAVNSVRTSPTMLARRIYELLACNTLVVSNPTTSLARNFAGMVVGAQAGEDIEAVLRRFESAPVEREKTCIRGLREVLSRHTAAHRLGEICGLTTGAALAPPAAEVLVVGRAATLQQARMLVDAYQRQSWQHKRLCLVLSGDALAFDGLPADAVRALAGGEEQVLLEFDDPALWISLFHPGDHYGAGFLQDLALGVRYGAGQLKIGKTPRFSWQGGQCLEESGAAFRQDAPLSPRAMIESRPALAQRGLSASLDRMEACADQGDHESGLALDGFEYCRDGAGKPMDAVDVR